MPILTLALALLGAQTAPAQAAPAWTYKESTDPAQPKNASASIRAADGTSRLIVRCDTAVQPIVSVQFIPKPPIPAGDSRTVTMTYNEAQAEMSQWQFPGAGAYNGEAVEVFILVDQIAKSKTIRVGVPEGEVMIEGSFPGPGSDAMFRKVYATCGLPYAMPSVTPGK